jgi:zinc protease
MFMLLILFSCWKNITGEIAMEKATNPIPLVLQEVSGPVSWIDLNVRAGAAHDPIGKEGLAYLTAKLLLDGGTKSLSPQEVEKLFATLGSSPSAQVDMEMVSFRFSFLHQDTETALAIFGDLLCEPRWDEGQFQRIKEETIVYLQKDALSSDERLGKMVFQNWLFEGHPYGHPIQGRTGVLENITLQDVQDFFRQRYIRPSMVLGVASNDVLSTESTDVQQLQDRLTAATPTSLYSNVTPKKVSSVSDRQVLIVEKETDSTGIVFGHPTLLTRDHPDWPAMLIAINVLGAHRQSFGLLYKELRSNRGLNYGDYAYVEMYRQASGSKNIDSSIGRLQNPFYIWLRPVSEENGPFALRAALAIVDDFVENGITQEQFATMQQYLSGQVVLWAKDGGKQLGWEVESTLMGWENPLETLPERLNDVSVEQVNEAIAKHLNPNQLKIVVVTKNAQKFIQSIEEKESMIVYEAKDIVLSEEQQQQDKNWSMYSVTASDTFHRSSSEIFQ